VASSSRDPGLAAVMSLVLPGLGQIYTGHWLWAIFWFVFTSGLWAVTGPLGLIVHIFAAMQASGQAKEH